MKNENFEMACACLSLSAWIPGLSKPLTRSNVWKLIRSGALQGLVLRNVPCVDDNLIRQARERLTRTRFTSALLEEYKKQGYTLLMPGDCLWPEELSKLGDQQPLFLFAKGNLDLLNQRRIAVAGSRDIQQTTHQIARLTGQKLAEESFVVITGGARGVDRSAQRACWYAKGSVILVPAMTVHDILRNPTEQAALQRGNLLFLCDTLPDEPFSSAKALQRNHMIYALGEAAIVVAARSGMGGSWNGASSCLRKGYSPVYVPLNDYDDCIGNKALLRMGAHAIDLSRSITDQLKKRPFFKQESLL